MGYRNEANITLGSKTFKLRATFAAIDEIESYFNKSIAEIVVNDIGNGRMRLSEIKAIIMAGVKGAGDRVDEGEIEDAILEAGVIETTTELLGFLTQAFSGAPETKKK